MITFKQFVESTWDSRGYRENPVPVSEYNKIMSADLFTKSKNN